MTNFQEAIKDIIYGANQFRTVCDGEEHQSYQEPDGESTFLRVPVGAYCLKMAYKVWHDVLMQNKNLNLPQALIGAGYSAKKMVNPAKTKEMLVAVLAEADLSPDEMDELAKMYRATHEKTEP